MGTCEEKPEEKEEPTVIAEEEHHKTALTIFAVWLAITIIISAILDNFFNGVPLGFTVPFLNIEATVSMILYYVAVLSAAIYIGVQGLKELFVERRFSVEFLMGVAGLGALYLDYRFEAATVLLLYCIAEYFEGYIQDRARRTVEKLSKFMPETAHVIIGGEVKDAFVNAVETGTVLLVRPGERIPLDGNVIEGFSHVDQALVTGESVPVPKKINDCVYAGTLNSTGVLKISVTKKASETLVSRIVQLVIESGKRKASIERLVDRFARFYVPIVIALAVFTAGALPFIAWRFLSNMVLPLTNPARGVVPKRLHNFRASNHVHSHNHSRQKRRNNQRRNLHRKTSQNQTSRL